VPLDLHRGLDALGRTGAVASPVMTPNAAVNKPAAKPGAAAQTGTKAAVSKPEAKPGPTSASRPEPHAGLGSLDQFPTDRFWRKARRGSDPISCLASNLKSDGFFILGTQWSHYDTFCLPKLHNFA
jgi:hypothetical protein